ncbi:glutamate racemase [Candidatus Cardinium hertigii]|uniref:glutamate racemase n=1 Tax=Candidatus Cardinium hertigii TaxID=247481 RepID=UPI003D7EC23C
MFSDIYTYAPIAIYDSGVGGLTIAKAIKAILPQESIHYIGDTKNLPYGDKTSVALCGYIAQVVNFCLSKRYKLLVIACNTATAAADYFMPNYLKTIGHKMGIINVVDPVVRYIDGMNHYNQIGLIATKYTVSYGIYAKRFRTTGITLTSLATPLLVPMVEASFNGKSLDHLLLDDYLNQIVSPNLDALIPACTHYIFLEQALNFFFKKHFSKEIELINPAKLTALAVQQLLSTHHLLNKTKKKLPDCFMATALTPSFQNASDKLFGQKPIAINLSDYTPSIDLASLC